MGVFLLKHSGETGGTFIVKEYHPRQVHLHPVTAKHLVEMAAGHERVQCRIPQMIYPVDLSKTSLP